LSGVAQELRLGRRVTVGRVHLRLSVGLLGLAVAVAGLLVVLPSVASAASVPCWQRVIADWSKHGAITSTYSASCLRQAMQNEPTDLKIYSTLDDNLQSALALKTRTVRRLAVAAPPVASLDGTGGSSSQTLLIFLVAGLGLTMVASAVVAARARPSAAVPRTIRGAQARSTTTGAPQVSRAGRTGRARNQARPKPRPGRTAAETCRPQSRTPPKRRAARQDQSTITLAATSGFVVADITGELVGRVECPMYGTAPDKPDALAVKAGLFKRNLVMADTIESIDTTAGVIDLNVERDSIPTFL
jgi:hypothetical protein